jgi:hypothetical protein
MLKKIIIFIVLIINVFVVTAQQSPKYFYQMKRNGSMLHLKWNRDMGGLIEIEVIVNGQKTLYHCPSEEGERELRLGTEPKPKIKLFRKADNQMVAMELDSPAAAPLLSDGLCILLISDSMYATRKKDFFQLKFNIEKNCTLSDSILVKTRLYWSKDSWANPTKDALLSEQDLPFGKNKTLSGKYSMDKMNKNGFLFLEIVDEKGNTLFTSEAIAVEIATEKK